MSFRAYDEYINTGIAWLSSIPSHWRAVPIKAIVATPVTDGPHETPELHSEGIPFVSAEAIKGGQINFGRIRGFISEEDHKKYSKKYKPQYGDLFMVKSGATTGRVAMVETYANFNIWSPLAAIRCNTSRAAPKYIYYVLQSNDFQTGIELNWSFGTQQNIGMGVIQNLPVALGSIHEQTQIAAFLDRETAKIDLLIEKQQRLIELLKEKRQAFISQAVTKGLNPDAPMKDSGVEWLGQVPEHWSCLPAKRIFRLATEPAPPNNDEELLSVYTDIGVRPRKDLEARGNKASTTDGYWRVKRGDLIVNKLLAWMGACGYSDYDGVTSPAYDILRPIKPINTKFYHYLFRSKIAQTEFKRWSRGIMEMRLRLYFDELGRIITPIPPEEEQNRIVNTIEAMEQKFDKLSSNASDAITLLHERRNALISAAVTGKIDVRDQVPQDVEEAVAS